MPRGRPKAPMKYVKLEIPEWAFVDFYRWLKTREHDIDLAFEDFKMLRGMLWILKKPLEYWRRSGQGNLIPW